MTDEVSCKLEDGSSQDWLDVKDFGAGCSDESTRPGIYFNIHKINKYINIIKIFLGMLNKRYIISIFKSLNKLELGPQVRYPNGRPPPMRRNDRVGSHRMNRDRPRRETPPGPATSIDKRRSEEKPLMSKGIE
uniref:Uncharacterized protein n=1 Tax=Heterorhabditis bacteriophora TaxID=37862 RepID=A0A1I7WL61_HETBA